MLFSKFYTYVLFTTLTIHECLTCSSEEWISVDQACYIFSDQTMDYSAAVNFCENKGGYVAVVNSQEENEYFGSKVSANGENSWISRENRHSELSFWKSGEPNNEGGNENCMELWPYRQWNDISCTVSLFAICEDINECESNLCRDQGTCVDRINMYTCFCRDGYTGNECETDINECESNPCLNQGTCIDGVNKYTCICVDYYTGNECETDMCEPVHSGGADIVFVVDTSSSQTEDNVNKQKQFIQEIITGIFDNKNTFQISLVTVSFEAVIHFYLNTYSTKESLISAVNNIRFDKGPSFTGNAFELIHEEVLQSSNGARFMNKYTLNTYVVVLFDGLSSNQTDDIARANELKQDRVVIIALGIGSHICHEELLDIASDSSKVLFARNDDLINYFFRYQVMDQCLDCYRGTSDVAVLMDASSTVNVQYFYNQLDALRQLVKVTHIGNDRVHLSYTRFANDVNMEFDFNDYLSTSDIVVAISTPTRLTKYSTAGNISNAIKHVTENGFTSVVGHRTYSRKFVVLFTNGKTDNPNDLEEKALTLKESGVLVVTVGIGLDVNITLLSRIASDPFYVYIIGDDVFTDANVLTSLIGSFEFDVCDLD